MFFVGTKPPMKSIKADYVIVGAPFDYTTTYRSGCDKGPTAIRDASDSIESYSPLLDRDIEDFIIYDHADIQISGSLKHDLDALEEFLSNLNSPVAILGGEHTLTFAAVGAFLKKYPDMMLVVLDAHTDLRDSYENSKLNHATWLKRTVELIDPSRTILLGVRSGTREEFRVPLLEMREDVEIKDATMKKLIDAEAIYLSIDVDVLDAPYVPGSGNPEPGGLPYRELEEFVHWLGTSTNLVGFDVVEVTPEHDLSGITAITAACIVRETLLSSIKSD